jgi:hypothetical protein
LDNKSYLGTVIANGTFSDRCRQFRFNETGEWCLDAYRGWLFPLERHGSYEAHRKRQLHVLIAAFISVNKILKEKRHVAHLKVAAVAQAE